MVIDYHDYKNKLLLKRKRYIKNKRLDFLYEKLFEWIDVCEDNGKCPECGADIEYRTELEYRGEYWGEPSYENMTYAKCPNCGYED